MIKPFGILAGTALTLSMAGQAAAVSMPSYGTPENDTVHIVADRDAVRCNPDTVSLSVDLTYSDFTPPAPVGDEVYDARLHDLIFIWDADEEVDFIAPERTLPAWRNSNVGYGPIFTPCYRTPGVKNPSVLVYDPATGKVRDDAYQLRVYDQDTKYPTTQTVCLSTSGNFDGAPAGAIPLTGSELTNSSAPWTTYANNGSRIRWLFRAGEEFDVSVNVDAAQGAGMCFDTFGGTDRAIINAPDTAGTAFATTTAHPDGAGVRFSGLEIRGNFDPAARTPHKTYPQEYSTDGIQINGAHRVLIDDCLFTGLGGTSIGFGTSSKQEDHVSLHINDTIVERTGGQYPLYFETRYHADSRISMTGVRATMLPEGQDDQSMGSLIRIQHIQNGYFAGCDFYSSVSLGQGVIKIQEARFADGGIFVMHGCALESPGIPILIANTAAWPTRHDGGPDRSTVHNIILNGNAITGGYGTSAFFSANAVGVTIRNNLFTLPAGAYRPPATHLNKIVALNARGTFGTEVGGAPFRLYNNTLRIWRTEADNNGTSSITEINYFQDGPSAYTAIAASNNVIWRPEATGHGPLSATVLFAPRCPGYRLSLTRGPDQVLAGDVATSGALPEVAYWTLYNGATAAQADFAGTAGQAAVYIVETATWYFERNGDISVVYGASGMTVTNLHADTWTTGQTARVYGDMGATAPLDASYATPAGTIAESAPQAGAGALGAAVGPDIAYDDGSAPRAVVRSEAAAPDIGWLQVTV